MTRTKRCGEACLHVALCPPWVKQCLGAKEHHAEVASAYYSILSLLSAVTSRCWALWFDVLIMVRGGCRFGGVHVSGWLGGKILAAHQPAQIREKRLV